MINTSAAYNNIITNGGHYEWRIVNNAKTIDADLKGGSLTLTLFEQASIGNVLASQLDFEYFDDGTALDPLYPLVLSFRAVSGSSASEWITKGTYHIDTIEQSPYSNVVKVTAFDSLLKGNSPWMQSGTFTTVTDRAIVQDIASTIGVTINADTLAEFANPITITQAPSIGANGTTSIEMLSYIGVIHGGNWIINSANELTLIKLFSEQETGAASVNIGDSVEDFDASPAEPIVGVCVWSGENNYYRVPNISDAEWAELDGRIIDAKCYIGGSQELAQTLYNKFSGKTYYPYATSKAWVDLKYELGDGITIRNASSVICNQTINLTALGSCSLNAKGLDKVTSHYPVPSPAERQIARNEAKTQASITVLGDRIESTVETVGEVQNQVTQNSTGISVLTQYQNDQETYMQYDGTVPVLKIGVAGESVHAEMRQDGFAIVDGAEESVFSDGKLTTNIVHAESETQTGNWAWVDEGVDGFSLIFME